MASISVQTHDPPPQALPAANASSSQPPPTEKSLVILKLGSSDVKAQTREIRTSRRIAISKYFENSSHRGDAGKNPR